MSGFSGRLTGKTPHRMLSAEMFYYMLSSMLLVLNLLFFVGLQNKSNIFLMRSVFYILSIFICPF